MQNVSSIYRRIFRMYGHTTEVKAVIAGDTYGIDSIYRAEQELSLFSDNNPGIGCCCAGSMRIRMIPNRHVPRMAEIKMSTRLVSPDGTEQSEWQPAGTYFVDTRSREKNGLAITCNAYDSMLKANRPYLENSTLSTWPADEADVVDEIADMMGVTVDSRTELAGYEVPIPEQDWTAREVLGWIGAANGGNWIITPANELLLVKLSGITSLLGPDRTKALLLGDSFIVLSTTVKYEDTRDLLSEDNTTAIKFGGDFVVMNGRGKDGSYNGTNNGLNIQRNARNMQNLGLLPPFSGVKLWRSHENTYVDEQVETEIDGALSVEIVQVEVEQSVMAGDATGRVLEADCPWATQEMADAILLQIEGFCWQGAVVEGAEITPAAELGDPVICDGVAFPLSSLSVIYDGAYAPTISAPADDEVDYEYPYESETQRQLGRKVALNENYYGFRVTREGGIEVVNIVDGEETTRMRLNSNVQEFLNADGVRALYFDPVAREYRFKGKVTITEGSLGLSSKFAIYPPDATEQEIDDFSITVPDGFSLIDRFNDALYRFLSIYQYEEYTHFESDADGYAAWDFVFTTVFGDVDFREEVKLYGKTTYFGPKTDDDEVATIGYIKSLTVHPIIITQPQDVTAAVNDPVAFTVVAARATGYQWYWRSGPGSAWSASTAASGKSATYTTTATTARDGQQYYCEVKNQYGSTNSDIVELTVI